MALAAKTKGEQNRQINPEMRGEPSRDLLDASQGRFASPPHLAGSSQRQDELGSQAAKYSAARQPCTRQAPRGHHAKRKGSPAQRRRCRRPGRRAPSPAAPTPPGARAPRPAAGKRSTALPRARRRARRRSRRARRARKGAPSGAPNSRGRRLLEVYCWTPRSIIYHQLGRKLSTQNS